MTFQEKNKLIKQAVRHYVDKYNVFTEEDLINEAWSRQQVRNAKKPSHVLKAAKDACVDFLRRWYKLSGNKRRAKIVYVSTMMDDNMSDMCEYVEDNTTDLLKEELYKQMNEEERKIVEYRLQGRTYAEIAKKLKKKKCTVYGIHKRMQERMKSKQEQLLGE